MSALPYTPPVFVRVEEAARLLGVSRARAYRMIAAGLLAHVAIYPGGPKRVPYDSILNVKAKALGEA